MATVNDFKAMSDEAIAKRIADLQAANQGTVPGGAASTTAKPTMASVMRGNQVQAPQLNLMQYLQPNQQMNNTNLASLLQRLQGRGSLMGGQANLGINPMTGRPANYGDYTKAPIQRLFGGTTEPNFADKLAYIFGGKIFQPSGAPTQAQDPYTITTFPDEGKEYPGFVGPTLPEEPVTFATDPMQIAEEPLMPDWSMQDIYGFAGDPAWGI